METTLVGRHDELAVIAAAVSGAGSGRPQAISIEGDSGAGKSALVRRGLADAPPDVQAIVLQGEEFTSDVPYATLADLVDIPVESGPVEAARQVLRRVAELSEPAPLVVVVEDLHWVDLASRQTLATVARRLEHEAVVLLATARPDHTGVDDGWSRLRRDPDRCVRIQVGQLGTDDIVALAADRGISLDAAAARRLADHTGGHALYVSALLDDVSPEVLTRPGGELPVPRDLSAVVAARLARADPGAASLLAALAVLGQPATLPVVATVAGVADPTDALEGALATGLAEPRREAALPVVAFAHPLYRRAVYDGLAPARRRELHQAASLVTDRRASLAHRVAAADRVDEAFAAELEAAAPAIRIGDGPVAAAQLWRWASEMSPDRDQHDRRLLAAAHLLVANDEGTADGLRADVDRCPDSPAKDLVLGQLAWQAGDVGEATFRLRRAAAGTDQAVVVEAGVRLANHLATLGRGQEAIDVASAALAREIDDPSLERQAWAMWALGVAGRDGAVAGLDRLEERLEGPAGECPMIDTPLLAVRGILGTFAGRPSAAIDDITLVVARSVSTPQARRRGHVDLAQCQYVTGRWDEAVVNARMALELSDDEHQWERGVAHQVLASVAAGRGQWDVAATQISAVAELEAGFGTPETSIAVRLAAIALAEARGSHEELLVAAEIRTAASPMLSTLSMLHPAAAARIETGDLDEAEVLVDRLAREGAARQLDVRARLGDLRGRLAVRRGDPVEAEEQFALAMEAATADTSVLLTAGTAMAYGRLLRNQARRQDAIAQLREARARYERLGAVPYLERVDQELQEAGLSRPTRRKDRSPLDLTPREQDVVTLVVAGRTNREAADELFVSEKAVEYHLRNVYGKVGVSSRRELRARLAVDA